MPTNCLKSPRPCLQSGSYTVAQCDTTVGEKKYEFAELRHRNPFQITSITDQQGVATYVYVSDQTEFPICNAVENLDCSVPLSMAHVKEVLSQ